MSFTNVYDDAQRAEAYATLEFPGTYYLAYRDLPVIIAENLNSPVGHLRPQEPFIVGPVRQ